MGRPSRSSSRRWWPWASVMIALLLPAAAWGQPVEEARRQEERARQAYAEERYEQAAELFAQAYALVPNALTKYNEARAWSAAGQAAPAADAFAQALSLNTLEVSYADYSRQHLTELERQLGAVVLTEPTGAKVSVAHARGREAPCRIHLAPGPYEVRVETPTEEPYQLEVDVVAGKSTQLTIAAPPTPPPGPPTGAPDPSEPSSADEDDGAAQRAGGWICVALGGAAGVAAVILGISTVTTAEQFEATDRTDVELHDDAVTLRTWTSVAAVAAAVVGGTGLVMVLTAPDGEEDEAQAAVRFGAGPGTVGTTATVRW